MQGGRPGGEALARRLLRLDAVYCVAAGLIVLALLAPLARLLAVPETVLAATGAVTLGWAYVVARLARRIDWRRPVAAVAAANVGAAAAVAALAAVSPTLGGRLLLAAVAVEVAALAGAQAKALRRRPI